MSLWQRPVRIALGTFAVAFGAILAFGARDRTPSVVADMVSRTDREAIIESRDAQIVQRENRLDNLKIEAERQLGYEDGSVKLLGNVAIEFEDGLVVDTEEAVYENGGDLVTMPRRTFFGRPNMQASAGSARYERKGDLLYLERNATVVLSSDGDSNLVAKTQISAEQALVAQTDGYMEFVGGVAIMGERQTMGADQIRTNLNPISLEMNSLALTGAARVAGNEQNTGSLQLMTAPTIGVSYVEEALQNIVLAGGSRLALFTDGTAGQLREMSATDIVVGYLEDELSSMVLDQAANISLVGNLNGPGTEIVGDHIEIALDSGGDAFEQIYANDNVSIRLPGEVGGMQTVSANSLEVIESGEDAGVARGLEAKFGGEVEYLETYADTDGGDSQLSRRIVSENLSAGLDRDLIGLHVATFTGGVRVDTGSLTGSAEQVIYDVVSEQVDFSGTDDQGRGPLLNDARGAVLATTINVHLDGPNIQATGSVSSVLSSSQDDSDGNSETKRPQLLRQDAPIYVTSNEFSYDADTSAATYTGSSRLWQDATEFRANSLVLDEASGDVTAVGAVETQIPLFQNTEDSDERVEVVARGSAASFEYADLSRTATYATTATLVTDVIDLSGTSIQLYLEPDGRSLARIFASGDVKLILEGRQMAGETMTYYEVDGRYEMTGDPVRIVEELTADADDGDMDTVECRETTGQALTFYVTSEALTVDAQSDVRTTSANQPCPAGP